MSAGGNAHDRQAQAPGAVARVVQVAQDERSAGCAARVAPDERGIDAGSVAPRVTAVVVTWRGEQWIESCLRALLATHYDALDVLVVDNGGRDSAAAVSRIANSGGVAAARCGGRVAVLALERNFGFAGGANRGIALAAARGADIVALVNQDCIVDADWLAPLVSTLIHDRDVGVVGATLFDDDGVTLQHAGGVVAANGLTSHIGRGNRRAKAVAASAINHDVDYVCGALIALRVDTWKRLGPLDERYFPAYFEEVDFCVRAREAGLRVLYVPASQGRHAEACSSDGASSSLYLRRYHRSRLRFVAHHLLGSGSASAWLRAELNWLLRLRRWREIAPVLAAYGQLPRLLAERRCEAARACREAASG